MNEDLKEIKDLILRIEDKIDVRLARIEKEHNSFKRWIFTVFLSFQAGLEYVKHKMGGL